VAICESFVLTGVCAVGIGCSLLHTQDKFQLKHRLPVCSNFLRGICDQDECPYPHVRLNRKAKICPYFAKGYCSAGEKCKYKHMKRKRDPSQASKKANPKKNDQSTVQNPTDHTQPINILPSFIQPISNRTSPPITVLPPPPIAFLPSFIQPSNSLPISHPVEVSVSVMGVNGMNGVNRPSDEYDK